MLTFATFSFAVVTLNIFLSTISSCNIQCLCNKKMDW
jgi:hypothetical protein